MNVLERQKFDKDVDALIDTDLTILNIMDNFIDNYDIEEKKNKFFDFLSLAFQSEQNIYKRLGFDNINEIDIKIKRFNYLLTLRDLDEENDFDIRTRINNKISHDYYKNPFVAKDGNNIIEITWQAFLDLSLANIYFLDKELETCKEKIKRKMLLQSKSHAIFQNDYLRNYLVMPIDEDSICGRRRCLVFNQQKEDIDDVYYNYFQRKSLENVYIQLDEFPDCTLDHNRIKKRIQEINLLNLKSSLFLLTEKEREDFHKEYPQMILNMAFYQKESKESIKKIEETFQEISKLKERPKIKTKNPKN